MFDFNEKKRKTLIISTVIYAVLMLLFILVVNFDKFSAFASVIGDKLSIFAPIIIGAIIAYLCIPLVRLYQNKIFHKIKSKRTIRTLSILFTYITLLVVVIAFMFLILPQLFSSIEELIRNLTNGTYLNAAIAWVNNILKRILSLQENYDPNVVFIDAEAVTEWLQEFFNDSTGYIQIITNGLVAYVSKFFISVKNLFLGLLFSIYFVISKERLYAMFKKIMMAFISPKKYNNLHSWAVYADKTFGGFVVGKLIDALFMMVMCSIAFGIAGVPFAVLIATVIGIANIIPYFGPFIGAIPSGFIVLIADPSKFIIFCILLLVIQQFDANVLEPKIVGDKIGLSSLGVMSAVIIMGGYFGIIGTFFGVPVFAVICTLVNAWIDSLLKKKEFSTALADYYSEKSFVDPNEEHISLWQKTFGFLNDKVFRKVGARFKKKKAQDSEAPVPPSAETEKTSEEAQENNVEAPASNEPKTSEEQEKTENKD